jgi:hypothetical protein
LLKVSLKTPPNKHIKETMEKSSILHFNFCNVH